MNALYAHMVALLNKKLSLGWPSKHAPTDVRATDAAQAIIPQGRERYLSEIAEQVREYESHAREQSDAARDVEALARAIELLGGRKGPTWKPYGPAA